MLMTILCPPVKGMDYYNTFWMAVTKRPLPFFGYMNSSKPTEANEGNKDAGCLVF